MKTNKNIVSINGTQYEVTADILKSIETICTAMGTKVTAKATAKADQPKAETVKVGKKNVKVLKVDKYGNKWIAQYDAAKYAAKKAEMIANGTYDSKNRSKVYKELGWIL